MRKGAEVSAPKERLTSCAVKERKRRLGSSSQKGTEERGGNGTCSALFFQRDRRRWEIYSVSLEQRRGLLLPLLIGKKGARTEEICSSSEI